MKLLSYLVIAVATSNLTAYELVVRAPEGEAFVIDIPHNESLTGVVEYLQSNFGGQSEYILDFMAGSGSKKMIKAKEAPKRDYMAYFSKNDKKDISFIVNTLGTCSLIKIAASQSEIKKAGDRIAPVHPLNFLLCIFTDEEMKASMVAMQDRRWVWGEFIDGLKDSSECETKRNNMRPEFIYDFAAKVGINPELIIPLIQNHQWKQLVVVLIKNIPRNTETGRYDM